jgi:uncharacterized protein (TIGR03435 family)
MPPSRKHDRIEEIMAHRIISHCVCARVGLAALLAGAAFSQDDGAPTAFIAADVRPTQETGNPLQNRLRGPFTGGGHYDLRGATLVDMIVSAYNVTPEKVLGGPSWLDYDRFDIHAVTPPATTPLAAKQMLQSLLADRFKLVLRKEDQPMTAFDLTVGKGKPKLKESDGSGEPGCKGQTQGLPPAPAPGEAAAPVNMASLTQTFTCKNMTMQALADEVWNIGFNIVGNNPVRDKTDLKGTWDFEFKISGGRPLPGMPASGDTISLTDALDKQLGLKLEEVKVPLPVIMVVSANKTPTPNAPDIAKMFPPAPTEFDVAEIKPSAPVAAGNGPIRMGLQIQPGGRVSVTGLPLKNLVLQAWGINADMLVGAPKWMDTDRYDIIAKAPANSLAVGEVRPDGAIGQAPPLDNDAVLAMVKALLIDRFKITTHMEERPAAAYDLVAVKPKMKKADPNSRTQWKEGPGADGKGDRTLGRLVTVQNMTMEQFGQKLQNIAGGYIHSTVLDKTGLEGGYDFTLAFSQAGLVNGRGGGVMVLNGVAVASPAAAAGGDASDPNGAVSLFDAMEKQLGIKLVETKRPVPVLVIDHIEQKPSDN